MIACTRQIYKIKKQAASWTSWAPMDQNREGLGGRNREGLGGRNREGLGGRNREGLGGRNREGLGGQNREGLGGRNREGLGGRNREGLGGRNREGLGGQNREGLYCLPGYCYMSWLVVSDDVIISPCILWIIKLVSTADPPPKVT